MAKMTVDYGKMQRRATGGRRAGIGWKAVGRAGVLAGTLFLALEILASWLFGALTPMGPAYMLLRGLEMGGRTDAPHDPALAVVALLLHLTLAVGVTAAFALLVAEWRRLQAVAVGLVYGVFLYVLTFLLADTGTVVFWSVADFTMLVNYAVFGAVMAWLYKRYQPARAASGAPEA